MDFLAINWFRIKINQNVKADIYIWAIKLFLYVHTIWLMRGLGCDWLCLDAYEYLELWVGMMVLIGLVYLPYSLYARYSFYHKAISRGAISDNMIVIKGEGNDFLKINPDEVIYIKVDDNYSDFELSNGETVSLRSSLTSAHNQLIKHPQFIRIHRSYVINSQFFESYKRAKGCIILQHQDQRFELPVSKSYKEAVVNYFTHPK